jgi:hypothetical protein
MANQEKSGGQGSNQQQRQGRQGGQQQDQRSAGNQGGQAGQQGGSTLPPGEKVGQWSEDEEDQGQNASDPAEAGGGGYNAPGGSQSGNRQSESEKPNTGSQSRWGSDADKNGSKR